MLCRKLVTFKGLGCVFNYLIVHAVENPCDNHDDCVIDMWRAYFMVSVTFPWPYPANRDIDPMLIQCWPIVYDAGPALSQHCVNVSCLLGMSPSALSTMRAQSCINLLPAKLSYCNHTYLKFQFHFEKNLPNCPKMTGHTKIHADENLVEGLLK